MYTKEIDLIGLSINEKRHLISILKKENTRMKFALRHLFDNRTEKEARDYDRLIKTNEKIINKLGGNGEITDDGDK